jgi:predicted DNA-binding transcriptional regulator YafY
LSQGEKKDKRAVRWIRLLQLLQSGPGRNASALAKACNVARRTIFRDLAALRQAGLPLNYDPKTERYSAGGWLLPPVQLTDEEALAISGLAKEFGMNRKLPFYDAAYNAAQKIEQTLSARLRQAIAPVSKAIEVQSVELSRLEGKASMFADLIDAIRRRRVIKIAYGSHTEDGTIKTKLRPYRLLFSQHCWYVIGRSSMHGDVRTFNLDRFKSLKVLSERYIFPRAFNLESHLGNAWHLIRDNVPDSYVVIRFSSFVAKNVAEVNWHKTQRTKFLDDGSLEFHVTVSGFKEIQWWILRYGDQAEVLKPARLRRIMQQRAANMATMYREEE